MNYFIAILKNLSGKEKLSLLRRIKGQKLKLKLFNFVIENTEVDNTAISSHLSYEKESNSLYTLKNRLLDDITTVKQDFITNEVVKVKEQVQSLVPLLMNGENELLLRELKKLEKSATRFELFSELKTIHYCYYLIYSNNTKKQEKHLKMIDGLAKKIEMSLEVEKLFYTRLIYAQELFYYNNRRLWDEIRMLREKLSYYYNTSQTQTARFYLLFTDTILLLASPIEIQGSVVLKNLQNLTKLFEYSFIKRTLPAAQRAIDGLYMRYYFITSNNNQLASLQRNLYPDILKIQNHFLFNSCFTVFTFTSVQDCINQGKTQQALAIITRTVKEDQLNKIPNNYSAHFYYLLALKEYYSQNFSTSSSYLIKARSCTINNASAWVFIEITLLNALNMLQQQEYLYIEHEINLLRRYFLKYKIDDAHIKAFNNLFRAIRDFEKTNDNNRVKGAIKHLQTETGLMTLISPIVEEAIVLH
jgi:hypothetical protein